MARSPRVLISYSHESAAHKARVLALAQELRGWGIDAWIDLFESAPPQGWPRWMVEQIEEADFVVLVCTETYRRRFEGKSSGERGKGVTFEGRLATHLLYEGELDLARLVPVVFEGAGVEVIPTVVRGANRLVLPGEFEGLCRHLLGQAEATPAPLGEPAVVSEGLPAELSPADELSLLQDELDERKALGEDVGELLERYRALRRELRDGPLLGLGDSLGQRYRLVEEAGKGGFATVWKAYDLEGRRFVAVKVLHGQWSSDRSKRERFEAGCRRMGGLDHPAIVRVLEPLGKDEHHYFTVLQWFEGGDLLHALRDQRIAPGKPALAVVGRALEGLVHAHAQGVIHRDIKPANILLDGEGRGALTDFDLARAEDSTHGTRTGAMGSFVYAAPEQLQDASKVDARADVYAMGMTVLFALTGSRPPLLVMAMNPAFVDELACGDDLREALKRALAIAPEKRTITCEQLAAAIEVELREPAGPPRRPATLRAVRGDVDLVLIRGRSFWMGSPESETGRHDDEGPQHEVELDSFYLAKTPVTNAQYARYLEAKPDAREPKFWGDAKYNRPNHPVAGVSWSEAKAYCDWAGLKLPTEAQWEYAARAGTTMRYWSGENEADLARVGWYRANSGRRLHPVGEKPANEFGLHDVHGNLWEWCLDSWAGYDQPVRGGDGLRREPDADSYRVLRGGCWGDTAVYARSASRNYRRPGNRSFFVGFRPVQGIP